MPATESIAIIGAGPAGLMAAEVISAAGVAVDVYDAMPSAGRKFLLAGIGGLNLTHSEPLPRFVQRYGARAGALEPWLQALPPQALCDWVRGLGLDTFVGSSGRVFPTDMKAAPLLRAWLSRLRASGVRLHARTRWLGWDEDGALRLAEPQGEWRLQPRATVLALGGGSWQRLGSNGAWLPWLRARGVDVAALQPSNCGFDVADWSEHLRTQHAGAALKNVALHFTNRSGQTFTQSGECVLTQTGLEGSLIYAASAFLRDEIAAKGSATLYLDLLAGRSAQDVAREVAHPRGAKSWSTHLKSRLNLHGAKVALLHECLSKEAFNNPAQLAQAIKALPITLVAARPLDEAISSAGGVRLEALNEHLMCRALPGVFCAGEMLDWEAPTGGYLLTACLASGRVAGQGVLHYLSKAQMGLASEVRA
jgi:uncharacterized flavoprotein (TIGR03862 family)